MASAPKVRQFIELLMSRRSIRDLGRRQILPDAETVDLIKTVVRETPTSFNMQSSRVVILLGDEHDRYWSEVARPALRKAVVDDDKFETGAKRMEMFRKAYGTALFFEDQKTVRAMQEKVASYADRFSQWSFHSTGMAQINTWTALELAGFGANLQHYNNLTQEFVVEAFDLPTDWLLHAELVFGSPESPAGDKTYIDDADRFVVKGAK